MINIGENINSNKMQILKVGIAGLGVVGKRRLQFINSHPYMRVVAVCDQYFKDTSNDQEFDAFVNYQDLLEIELDVLFVCMPNDISPIITTEAIKKNIHVFCEKPPGRTVLDILNVIETEKLYPKVKLMYGFNHRYHESIKMALAIIKSKELGEIINIRGVYGKSKIVGFESGWRCHRDIAGGGILLDQGIHMVDLLRLFCGEFVEIKSFISNSYWKHDVEDNAFAIMKDAAGKIAMIHSTATQWQHKFNLEIFFSEGYIELHGILSGSKSYGEEKIVIGKRDDDSLNGQMETRTVNFLEDNSWRDEVFYFCDCILNNKSIEHGSSKDALNTMKLVYAIYFNDKDWREKYEIENPYLNEI